jgi:SPP1 family predicted phage head-tail adaptor
MSGRLIHAGMLSERLVFEEAIRVADGLGGYTESWETYGERWAYVEMLGGSRGEEADASVSTISVRAIIRRDTAIHAAMRCVMGGMVHIIEWIAPYGTDHGFTELRLTRGGNAA